MKSTAQKRARQEEPDASRSDVATQSNKNTLDSSNYLTYDIVRIVFQYLNARDLQSAAIVCRSWLGAANNEKGIRRGPCCFNIFYRTIKKFERNVRRIPNLNNIYHNIENIRIKPLIGFFFIHPILYCNANEIQCDLSYYLPEHCEAVILHCDGIVMDNAVMEGHPDSNNIACVLLPQIPNVKIKFFKMTLLMPDILVSTKADIQDYIQKSAEYQELINTIKYETSRSNYETSTCLMLLCKNMTDFWRTSYWTYTIEHNKEEIGINSVWGGIFNDVQHKTKKRFERTNCVAVLITGVIQTWSIVLDKKCNTKEQVEAKLKSFKNKVKLKKHSIGFVFVSLIRRFFKVYEEESMEVTIFKKLLPKVPLVGCLGSWGFGNTTVRNKQEDYEMDYESECYSTVFLILTYD